MEEKRNGETRLAYILGVPLAEDVVRQWPQQNFPSLDIRLLQRSVPK
jgi:hypothetical protein